MASLYTRMRNRSSWLALLGVFCIALVLASGVVQAVHTHDSGQPDHDCSLCVSAHHVVQIAPTVELSNVSRPIAAVAFSVASALPQRRFFFKLACRPPPDDSVLA